LALSSRAKAHFDSIKNFFLFIFFMKNLCFRQIS
jgi:hypothetical protein